ncbi:PREDICTED: protein borderless isoform X2 [Nicrophorus vespilloides]|uniref:Protein borderless isoform X2 n=1 Tax=Nicrophorus vespilloides TaxID=110193 RepID=A0ABM1MEJ6_NICVS|nr:PREDICTED: protein borderless isoform X2 [Nicrophorus vespilloides]
MGLVLEVCYQPVKLILIPEAARSFPSRPHAQLASIQFDLLFRARLKLLSLRSFIEMFGRYPGAILLVFSLLTVRAYFYEDDEKQQPSYLTAAVGDFTIMNCDLDFPQTIPIPYILNWNREGKTVFSWNNGRLTATDPYVGRIHLLEEQHAIRYGGASINLTSIRESDAGWFECKVIFPNRTPNSRNNGTWFYLTVNGNLLAVPPINQTTMEHEEAHFSCVTKDKDTIVTWYKDGIPLNELPDILQRSWISSEGSLTIRPAAMGDLGEYECEAVTPDGEKQSAKAYLNVQYKAKVIYAPREIHLPYGRSAILDCHFRANPPLTNLRWEKDGFLFDPYNVQGVFYRRNGSLYFSKVDESHTGHYSCTPYNDLGTEGPSPSIHVIVQRPPVFVVTPNPLYLRKLGETLEMPCDARDGENEHKPIIVWYKKDGSSLPVGRYSIRDGNLTIINIQEDDRGMYQCSATNEAATISTETQLIVENVPPRAPYNLTADSSLTSVHLKWEAGRKVPNIEYNIWYRPVETPEWKTIKVSGKKALETTISNLNSGREYEFMVLSKDQHGDGLFSKTIRVWTKGYNAEYSSAGSTNPHSIGSPKDVQVKSTADGFLVVWNPPEYGLEELRVYVVRWYEGPRQYLCGTAETKNTSYLVSDLEEGNDYHFEVLAMAFDEYQAASDKFAITVPSYSRIKAISIGLLVVCLVVAALGVAAFYLKKTYWNKLSSSDSKN